MSYINAATWKGMLQDDLGTLVDETKIHSRRYAEYVNSLQQRDNERADVTPSTFTPHEITSPEGDKVTPAQIKKEVETFRDTLNELIDVLEKFTKH